MSWRLFFCLLALVGPLCVAGPASVVARSCVDSCPDDDEQGQCAPGCDDCSCCHLVVGLEPVQVAVESAPARQPVEHDIAVPSSIDPDEILKVPKASA